MHINLHIWMKLRNELGMTSAQPTGHEDHCEYGSVTRRQVFTEDWMRRIAAMLGLRGLEWTAGNPVPFGWHFPLLGAETHRNNLRPDGFPGLGIPLPDISSKRLVATGRILESLGRIGMGQKLERTSRIAAITAKSTSQGPATSVTVEHAFHDLLSSTPILNENHTFLILDTPFTVMPPARTEAIYTIVKTITPDDTMLFQFSALSFNSHKIHLDRDYARNVEGYPDLVVNGGLTTLLMTEIARADFGENIKRLSIRNSAPLFCNRPVHFARSDQDGRHAILAIDDEGRIAAGMEFETDDI
jgi:3-methylfumaryl-CoA hydratase